MARNQAITIHFIQGTNKHHHAYLHKLRNQFLNRQDIYPTNLTDTYNVMSCHTGDHVQHIPSGDGLMFTTTGDNEEHTESGTVLNMQDSNHPNIVAGMVGQVHENIRCLGCNKYGHYQSHCPQASSGGQ